jgi:hypothetical protein
MPSAAIDANPYKDLYIYYLSGQFRSARNFRPTDYIGNWEEGGFSFLFFTRPRKDLVESLIREMPGVHLVDDYHMTYEQWQGSDCAPRRIGRFTVTPPWFAAAREPAADTIVLDPGVVFGTGTHPDHAGLPGSPVMGAGRRPCRQRPGPGHRHRLAGAGSRPPGLPQRSWPRT